MRKKGSRHPFRAIRDVFKNPHARPPLLHFYDNIGFAFSSIMVMYVATYILEAPEAAPKFLLVFLIPSFFLTPLWMPLARRIGKKAVWSFSFYLSAACFGGMFFLGKGDDNLLMLAGFFAGIANGAAHVIGPSLLSDTVDYDELQTGERKEVPISRLGTLHGKPPTALPLYRDWRYAVLFRVSAKCHTNP